MGIIANRRGILRLVYPLIFLSIFGGNLVCFGGLPHFAAFLKGIESLKGDPSFCCFVAFAVFSTGVMTY